MFTQCCVLVEEPPFAGIAQLHIVAICISTLKTKYLAHCTEEETFYRQQETPEPLFMISGE